MAPKLGLNRAAAMPIPQITLPSVKTRPEVANAVMKHAGDVKKTAGGGIAASQISGNQNLRGCGPSTTPGAGIIQ